MTDAKNFNKTDWLEMMNTIYPLPPAPPEECRDVYLKNLAVLYDDYAEESDDSSVTSPGPDYGKIRFDSLLEIAPMNIEENILRDHIMHLVKPSKTRRPTSSEKKFDIRPPVRDIHKMLKDRYDNIASSIGFMAVLYQFQQLRERLIVVRELWSMTADIDKSLRMFSWSIKDYYFRFNQPNCTYLDSLEFRLKNKMECYKFRTDIREVMRLIDELCEDFLLRRDICKNSLVTIRDAQLDIKELLTSSQVEDEKQNLQLTIAKHQTPRSADPNGTRTKALAMKINYNDFYMPIESRYRINWAQTNMEQTLLYTDLSLKAKTEELNKLSTDFAQISHLWSISALAYEMEIFQLKGRISEAEILYEEEFEKAESIIQLTHSKLAKAKDDLKFYKEQIPMFHSKIAEVKEIFAKQEAARQSQRKPSREPTIVKFKKPIQKKKK